MSTEQNKNVILRWRQGLNERNLNVIDDLFAPEYVGHITGVPGPVRGPVAFKQLFTAYLAAFDISVTPEFLIAEGTWWQCTMSIGSSTPVISKGIPPTGKELSVTSTDIYRIVDGKVVEQWFEADYTGMMQQLSVLPSPRHVGS